MALVKSLFKSSINEKKNDKSVLVGNKKRMIIHHSITNNRKIKEKLEVEKVLPALVLSPMRCERQWFHFHLSWRGGRGESCHLDKVE